MKPTVAVDFDGVICVHEAWQGVDHFGKIIPGAREFLEELSTFAFILIYSCRGNKQLCAGYTAQDLKLKVKNFMQENKLPYDDVYVGQGKPIASAYIDDRGVACNPQAYVDPANVYANAIFNTRFLCQANTDTIDNNGVIQKVEHPKVSIIVAMTNDRLISRDNQVPWHIPEDMQHFKETTKGCTVIMGRKTFESMNSKPLPNRDNIVVTRTPENIKKSKHDFFITTSFANAIECATALGKKIFIIGGSQIYRQALANGYVDKMIISYVKGTYKEETNDTYFPLTNPLEWKQKSLTKHKGFEVIVYNKKKGK